MKKTSLIVLTAATLIGWGFILFDYLNEDQSANTNPLISKKQNIEIHTQAQSIEKISNSNANKINKSKLSNESIAVAANKNSNNSIDDIKNRYTSSTDQDFIQNLKQLEQKEAINAYNQRVGQKLIEINESQSSKKQFIYEAKTLLLIDEKPLRISAKEALILQPIISKIKNNYNKIIEANLYASDQKELARTELLKTYFKKQYGFNINIKNKSFDQDQKKIALEIILKESTM